MKAKVRVPIRVKLYSGDEMVEVEGFSSLDKTGTTAFVLMENLRLSKNRYGEARREVG